VTATALVAAVGDRSCFKNGRQFAAWLGLVPRQRSSGGRNRLFGISKRGDRYLRTLMIHGARAALGKAGGKQDPRSRRHACTLVPTILRGGLARSIMPRAPDARAQ
jgi:transposase